MHIPAALMLSISVATGLVGMIFLLVPARIRALETRLNAPWGERELLSLRIGVRGERDLERVLNRHILAGQVVWDDFLLRRPRLFGAALCLLALWLGGWVQV